MVSIAIATYNGERFIRQQIDSILSQSIQDFEIVVCDDNSHDETVNILRSYSIKDSRIRLFTNNENVGFKRNFERAISKCKGEYIALCDQDDIWMPNHLQTLLNIIGDYPMACGNALFIDENGSSLGVSLSERENLSNFPSPGLDQAYTITFYRSAFQGASMLMKKSFCERCMPIPEKVEFHDMWFCLLGCFSGGISYTYEIINQYRMHGSNVTGYRISPRNKSEDVIYILFRKKSWIRRKNMLEEMIRDDNHYIDNDFKLIVKKWLNIINRDDSILGKIVNLPFYMKNFKKIFG